METMELQEFVSKTLNQVINGVKDAQESTKESGATISPKTMGKINCVDFDVAVTTSSGEKTKGGLGIFVAGFGVGAQGQSDASSVSVSRIKFSIPVILP